MPTLIDEIKSVVLVKGELGNQKKNKIKMFSLEVLNYQDTDANEKK